MASPVPIIRTMKPIRTLHALVASPALLGLALLPAGAGTYTQDFDFPDGTTGLGLQDGTFFASNDGICQVIGNRARITSDAQGNTRASFRMPAVIDSHLGFTLTFDYEFGDAAGENPPADGWSISYGNIPAFPGGPAGGHGNAEEGFGSGNEISYELDTWDNGAGEGGVNIAVNGTDIAGGFQPGLPIGDGDVAIGTVTITFDPYETSFISTGLPGNNAAFMNLPHGFTPDKLHSFVFSARTGGADEDLFIDNVVINTGVQKDTDGDGLADGWELLWGYDPNLADSDGNGTADGDEDGDGDGLTEIDEQRLCGDPTNPDTDADGTNDGSDDLPNDPLNTVDTDGDYVADPNDNCPTVANIAQFDVDGDGDGDACDNDTDNDGIDDADETCRNLRSAHQPVRSRHRRRRPRRRHRAPRPERSRHRPDQPRHRRRPVQ